jgi:hypothetical protein
MNLNVLTVSVMVLITREWLANPVIVAELTKHPLGAAIWNEIARIHKRVSEFRQQRMAIEAVLAELTEKLTHHGDIHDRKARALHNLLLFMAEATNDPALARNLRELDALLFPDQLRIIHMSYFAEAGAIIELEQRVTPEILRTLESLRVGDQTLADIYREWVEAGHALGQCAQQRARVEASLSAHGSAAPQTRARKVRSAWIRGVRLLLDALDMLELSDATRERLLAPLQKGVRDAARRRDQNTEPDVEPEIQPDSKPADTGYVQPDVELADTSYAQPGVRPDLRPAIWSDGEPDIRPENSPGVISGIGPRIESDARHGILPPMRAAPPPRPPPTSPERAVVTAPG